MNIHDVAFARHLGLQRCGSIPLTGGRAEDLIDAAEAGLAAGADLARRGRLLVWHRDDTVDDGAGEAETGGYLDESDMPPWDTWVAYVDSEACSGYLVSLVPAEFIEAVSRAIAYNAYEALYWLRGTSLRLARVLEDDGLLV
jgi:hypothetical protein